MKDKKILAIIPARGGSKGIPRKNIRLLAGKPLIAYSIETALKSKYIDRVVVSTDDKEIAEVAKLYGAEVIMRPKELAGDEVPLDPVVFHVVNTIENGENAKYNFILTLQATSPLLTTKTLDQAIENMIDSNYDTLISVKDETHIYWVKKDGVFTPFYEERKNRQYMDPIYKETGALLFSKRGVISKNNRIGKKMFLFKVPRDESIDIDTYQDWWITENLLKKQTIVLRVDGDNKIGLGHIYRMITLAGRIIFNHDIIFLMDATKPLGIEKVKEYGYPIITFEGNEMLFKSLEKINPNIVINDLLNTNADYISKLRKRWYFVINFEDLGDGTKLANLVINALYENTYSQKNHYYGYKYVCLKDDFFIFPPKKVNEDVKNILVTFGGTDLNNLTLRTLKAIVDLNTKECNVNVILGLGYNSKKELYNYVNSLKNRGYNINVKENVKSMAKEMYDADLVITSNGRTIYEVASIGVPCISISQHEREVRHLFTHNSNAIMDLGMACNVSKEDIASAIKELIENYETRRGMHEKLLKFDLKSGTDRVIKIIFDKYYEWSKNGN